MKLSSRLLCVVILSVFGLLVVVGMSLYNLHGSILAERQTQTRLLLEYANHALEYYAGMERDGKLTREQAQAQAVEAMRAFGTKDNYFQVVDDTNTVRVHANAKYLGMQTRGVKQQNGEYSFDLYREAVRKQGFPAYVTLPVKKPGGDEKSLAPKLNGLSYFKPWGWLVMAGFYVDDISANTVRYSRGLIVVAVFTVLLTALLLAYVARSIYARLGGEPTFAAAMAEAVARGDLTMQLPTARTGSLLWSLGRMQQQMRDLVGRVKRDSGVLTEAMDQIHEGMERVRGASTESSGATTATAASVEEMTVSINMIAQSAKETETYSSQAVSLVSDGEQNVRQALKEIRTTSEEMEKACGRVVKLSDSTRQIGRIADVIKEIAEQTNLLALNAAIEAARAGEQGRGFSVVAEEVGKLAKRTAQATAEISGSLRAVRDETDEIAGAMQSLAPQMARGASSAAAVVDTLAEIRANSDGILEKIRDMAYATSEQNTASANIAGNIERIARMLDESEQSVHAAVDRVKEITGMAHELDTSMACFRV